MSDSLKILILLSIFSCVCCGFDRYSGKKVDESRVKELKENGRAELCTIEVKPCTPHEGSRIDGTCNNFKEPSKGTARGPYARLLKFDYGNDKKNSSEPKEDKVLPSARKVRTTLQTDGRVVDKIMFNAAAVHYLEFITRDISYMSGTLDYLQRGCCDKESSPHCQPINVPEDDPYLSVTDIRCLNFTRAQTFQDVGCITGIIPPEQINYQTPVIDLSTVYGVDEEALDNIRPREHGLLYLEKRLDNISLANISESCVTDGNNKTTCKSEESKQNEKNQTLRYKFGYPEAGNHDIRTTTIGIFFARNHNRIAKILEKINPCWKDDRLFKVARQINIATAANIFLYELLPGLLGHKVLMNNGLLSQHVTHLTAYIEDAVPLVYAEYDSAIRFYHTMIDGRIKKYDENFIYLDEIPLSNTLFRQVSIERNKTLEEINKGTFYQYSGKIDDIQDPEISERYFGNLQRAQDLIATDIQRGRDMGLRGYNEYRQLCGLNPAKEFEDLLDVIDIEKVQALKKLYKNLDDVDLLAGIMSENLVQGTYAGPMLLCIIIKQLQIFKLADRFWFERGDQMHSFTLEQLHEMRRTNIANFACDNAEGIKIIQPQAFLSIGHGNTPVPCSHIQGPDLTKWRDNNCNKNRQTLETNNALQYKNQFSQLSFAPSSFDSFFDSLFKKPSEVLHKT